MPKIDTTAADRALAAERRAWSTALVTAERTIADLRRQLEATQPTGQFGIDVSINAESDMTIRQKYQQILAAYGNIGLGPHMKAFDAGGGWQAARNNLVAMGWGSKPNEQQPVLCSKRHTEQSFNQLMDDMAAGGIWWACFWQECNDDVRDGKVSVADYRAAYQSMDTLRRRHPHGDLVRLLPIMNAYVVIDQAAIAAGKFDTLTLCKGLPIDAIGYDLYNDSWYPATWSPSAHLTPAVNAGAALGVPWCIPEFGVQASTKTAGDGDAGAARRLQAVIDFCRASSTFAWLNYWEGKGENGDWTLVGKPGQQVLANALTP